MNSFTRKLAVAGLGVAALVGGLGEALPASAAVNPYDRIVTVTSSRTGRQLGKVGFKAPYCSNGFSGYAFVSPTCYFGSVDVIENKSDDAIVWRATDAEYRTKTGLNTYTPWTKVDNIVTWSAVRCDSSPYSQCANDLGTSLCANDFGYYACTSQGGIGTSTQWTYTDGYGCGRYYEHSLAVRCDIPVSIAPGAQLRTHTNVFFWEKSTGQWGHAGLDRIIS